MKKLALIVLLTLLSTVAGAAELNPPAQKAFDSAYELKKKGQFYDAIKFYELAIRLAPEFQGIWMEFVGCLRKANYLQRAARAGWRALELGPPTADIWGNLGNVFDQAREWDAAMAAFKKAEALSDDKRWIAQKFLNLGYGEMVSGHEGLALKTFQYALKVDPSHGLAMVDCGVAKASLGNIEEGVKEIKKGIAQIRKEHNNKPGQYGGIKYAQTALDIVEKDGKIKPSVDFRKEPFQRLPERFLAQPPKGSALSLKIDDKVERSYQISPQGILTITTPESWRERIVEKTYPVTEFKSSATVYSPDNGERFEFLLTPYPTTKKISEVESIVKKIGQQRLKTSVEKKLDLIQVKSPSANGYVYILTDKKLVGNKLKEGEYLHAIQGVIKSGNSWSYITVLTDNRAEKFVEEMLTIMKSISYRE
ncbi:MAG: tetratricopeptide repeat protein [PVC group bacterium]